jgi:hypothetical protein
VKLTSYLHLVPILRVSEAMILYLIHIHGVQRETFSITFNTGMLISP